MPKTITVRIPVAVDPNGRWYTYGWSSKDGGKCGVENMEQLLESCDYDTIGPGEVMFWVTAELPVPEAAEVPATHIEAEN